MVFDLLWFEKHQKKLLWLANTSIGRWILRINGNRSSVGKNRIVKITPNAIFWVKKLSKKKITVDAEFRTHNKYSKRIYYAFYPVWWTMHFIDWLLLDRFSITNRWSFGFATLTVFCDPSSGSTTVDGNIAASNAAWATVRGATTGTADKTSATGYMCRSSLVTGTYHITRGFFTWDTSALGAAAVISSAVASFFDDGSGSFDANTDSSSINIVQSTQASNNDLVNNDYDNIGTTSFASITMASWIPGAGIYHNFTLDANGIANIAKTGVSKFAGLTSRDFSNSAPTGSNSRGIYFADQAGTTNDPKLVVTYTIPSGASGSGLSLMGVSI